MIGFHDVSVTFGTRKVLDGITLELAPARRVGLIGESGSGKTTIGRLALALLSPTTGTVTWQGEPYPLLDRTARQERRRFVQPVFQDGSGALNPRRTVGASIADALEAGGRRDRRDAVGQLLRDVGLSVDHAARRPGELSGGQRQRVGIARALASGARFLVLDEPTSALDPTTQERILHLLDRLTASRGLGYLLITHHMGLIERLCDDVIVLHDGRIVERDDAAGIIDRPEHPHTRSLVAAATALQAPMTATTSRWRAHDFHPRTGDHE